MRMRIRIFALLVLLAAPAPAAFEGITCRGCSTLYGAVVGIDGGEVQVLRLDCEPVSLPTTAKRQKKLDRLKLGHYYTLYAGGDGQVRDWKHDRSLTAAELKLCEEPPLPAEVITVTQPELTAERAWKFLRDEAEDPIVSPTDRGIFGDAVRWGWRKARPRIRSCLMAAGIPARRSLPSGTVDPCDLFEEGLRDMKTSHAKHGAAPHPGLVAAYGALCPKEK